MSTEHPYALSTPFGRYLRPTTWYACWKTCWVTHYLLSVPSFPHCHIQLRLTLLPGPEVTLAAGTPASNSGRDFRLDKKPARQTELLPPTQAETPAWQETMLNNRNLGPNSRGDHLLNHKSYKSGEREETETKEQISIQQRKLRNQDLGL